MNIVTDAGIKAERIERYECLNPEQITAEINKLSQSLKYYKSKPLENHNENIADLQLSIDVLKELKKVS